jgi:exonuclease SbcC
MSYQVQLVEHTRFTQLLDAELELKRKKEELADREKRISELESVLDLKDFTISQGAKELAAHVDQIRRLEGVECGKSPSETLTRRMVQKNQEYRELRAQKLELEKRIKVLEDQPEALSSLRAQFGSALEKLKEIRWFLQDVGHSVNDELYVASIKEYGARKAAEGRNEGCCYQYAKEATERAKKAEAEAKFWQERNDANYRSNKSLWQQLSQAEKDAATWKQSSDVSYAHALVLQDKVKAAEEALDNICIFINIHPSVPKKETKPNS